MAEKKLDVRFVFIIVLLLLAVFYVNVLGSVQPVQLPQRLAAFPDKIGSFSMVSEQRFSEAVEATAGMDEYIMWQFQDPSGYTLGLYVGYYKDQSEGSIIHSPKHCMPGSGWDPIETREVALTNKMGQTYNISRMILQKGMDKQIAQYWFHGRGRIVASEYVDRALMVFDSIVRHRSDGSLVRVTGPGNDLEKDLAKQEDFISALMPVLDDFLPK